MGDIYDPKFVKGVFDRCSERYIAFSLICSFGFTERWRQQCVAAMPAPPRFAKEKVDPRGAIE
jgi:ubiquinone/menaquinone biosynthesis C-methylase UbiE